MRIALLFYGQARFVDKPEVVKVYKDIIEKYNADVFCHVWWKDTDDETYASTLNRLPNYKIPKDAIEKIKQNYNPVCIHVDEPEIFQFPAEMQKFIDNKFTGKYHPAGDLYNNTTYSNVLSQFASIKRVAQIFDEYRQKKNEEYDWIILARYDTKIIHIPDLSACDNTKFYIPNYDDWFAHMVTFMGIKFLDWIKNIFNDVDKVYEYIEDPCTEPFMLHTFLLRHNTEDIIKCPMSVEIVRS